MEVRCEGWGNWKDLRISWNRLCLCYEKLSQFQDALFLYENLVGKMKSVMGDDHPFIKEVEDRISKVQERMEESSVGSEELNSEHKVPQEGVDGLACKILSEAIRDVSLREILEIEHGALDEQIADIGKQIGSIKLS